jgi:histidine triad (HIT) family protein
MFMENCIFCRIIKGEVPTHKVYEDENFLAFLDINPQSPGHTQVVPKEHHRWVWDLPTQEGVPGNVGDFFKVAQKIAFAQRKAYDTPFILSRIVGDEVPHAHIWVFPNKDVPGDKMDFDVNAEKIKKELVK